MTRLMSAKRNLWVCNSPLDEFLARKILAQKKVLMPPRQEFLSQGLARVEAWLKDEPLLHWVKPESGSLFL
jgi:hypothetical protein